jgi:hypothetical protein
MRSVGGVLFAAGAVVLLVRKSGHNEWSDFEQLLAVLIPAAVLYLLALGLVEGIPSQDARPWQSVLMVVAILLSPLVLIEFLRWVGASTNDALYEAGVFAVTGLLAGYAAQRARTPYAALLAGLAFLVAWLLVWGKILDHPSAGTYRWLLVVAAALLMAVAVALARRNEIGAGEVATAGGLAAVAAGVFGVVVGAFVGLFRSITALGGSASSSLSAQHLNSLSVHTSGLQHFGWDLYLLIVSLALMWTGSRWRVRGLGYVAAAGLLGFVISVGADITRVESGRAASHSVGWPLALLLVGFAGLAAPALYRRDQ